MPRAVTRKCTWYKATSPPKLSPSILAEGLSLSPIKVSSQTQLKPIYIKDNGPEVRVLTMVAG